MDLINGRFTAIHFGVLCNTAIVTGAKGETPVYGSDFKDTSPLWSQTIPIPPFLSLFLYELTLENPATLLFIPAIKVKVSFLYIFVC